MLNTTNIFRQTLDTFHMFGTTMISSLLLTALASFLHFVFWLWLDPPLTALRYVMYFRFYRWRHTVMPLSSLAAQVAKSTWCRPGWGILVNSGAVSSLSYADNNYEYSQAATTLLCQEIAMFGPVHQNVALEAKPAIYECPVCLRHLSHLSICCFLLRLLKKLLSVVTTVSVCVYMCIQALL